MTGKIVEPSNTVRTGKLPLIPLSSRHGLYAAARCPESGAPRFNVFVTAACVEQQDSFVTLDLLPLDKFLDRNKSSAAFRSGENSFQRRQVTAGCKHFAVAGRPRLAATGIKVRKDQRIAERFGNSQTGSYCGGVGPELCTFAVLLERPDDWCATCGLCGNHPRTLAAEATHD